jgi:hypothetical protein
MTTRMLSFAVAGLAAVMASPAGAGSPCCCASPCVAAPPPVIVYRPHEMPEIYVVDRGPVYSGPGIYAAPTVVVPRRLANYPYVARDYPDYRLRYYPAYSRAWRARAPRSR